MMRTILVQLVLLLAVLTGCSIPTAAQNAPVMLNWLEATPPPVPTGVSWGVPWPRGAVPPDQPFTLMAANGSALPVQTWPLAYWPDGSLKWSGFATVAGPETTGPLALTPSTATSADSLSVQVREREDAIEINTGRLLMRIPRQGSSLIESMSIDGRVVARDGRLVAILQHGPDGDVLDAPAREPFTSRIDSVAVEQAGPVRAVVRIDGMHRAEEGDRAWLPFTVRLYLYAEREPVRLVHSVVYDGNQEQDFVRGLGLAFAVPMREEIHNRHVRFSGPGDGLWAEPVQPLTGRRPLIYEGENVYPDQVAGRRVPDYEAYDPRGQRLIDDWAVWNDFKLVQTTPDGFTVAKRTNPQSTWLKATAGTRASGLVFVGDVSGGVGVGVKDFWQSYPSTLEVRDAAGDAAELRIWLWSPEAPAMDMRHYDTVAHGLEASYEDVQPGFSTAHGVARTSELTLFPSAAVPSDEELVWQAALSQAPPLLVAPPEHLHAVRAFGIWSLPDRSTPGKRWIEDQLDAAVAFYQTEIEQRRWYGFWDYGDVMHAYDPVRHTWRYDIGGYAWANSELVPDLWLWYSFLRTGRADVFRMAEAMTRHTGEVDVYHLGRFAGLGSRHNVRHWGDGAKEARISQAALRRFYYYLTTDERTGDLMHEVADADYTTLTLDPMRLAMPENEHPSTMPARARVGPDWLAFVGNWMTEWERTGNPAYRDKILTGMDSIAAMPYGLFSGPGVLGYDPETGALVNEAGPEAEHTSHLVMIMGGAEVLFELDQLIDHAGWDRAFMQYCELYTMPDDDPARTDANRGIGGGSFPNWHARMTAYAAWVQDDPELAARAWREFLGDPDSRRARTGNRFAPRLVEGPETLRPTYEVPWISTNETAQWSLNAIQLLELVGDAMPERHPVGVEDDSGDGD